MADEAVTSEVVGRESAALSLVEVGLGSALHSFRVPFAGYFLSLNQGFFLSRAVSQVRGMAGARTLPMQVSMVASLLKSLSPAGKKLTPMLAISAQGLCYSAGTLALGATLPGAVLGSMLASSWAFVQPALLYTLLYGRAIHEAAAHYLDRFGLWGWLAALLAAKALLAGLLAVTAFRISGGSFEAYRQRLLLASPQGDAVLPQRSEGVARALAGAARDLTRPLFVASLLLTVGYFYFADHARSELIWKLLRPVGLGFLLFFVARMPWLPALARRIGGRTGSALERALQLVTLQPQQRPEPGPDHSMPGPRPPSKPAGAGPSLPKS